MNVFKQQNMREDAVQAEQGKQTGLQGGMMCNCCCIRHGELVCIALYTVLMGKETARDTSPLWFLMTLTELH